ncbi:hypothetical protein SLS56_010479 [Neofusicoccum ribis]|uniref:DAPG hydrolase PhiG domain-containing protein n=1 Tax=Neofusicoccum ribis TaxID=45134 RepID=A0ABR3SFR2_9PEZI
MALRVLIQAFFKLTKNKSLMSKKASMRLKSPFIAPFIALGGSSSASSLYPRQLNTSSSTGSVNTTAPIPLSQSTISQNQAPYEEDASKYYLGYYDSDFTRPFAKYWNPNVLPISDEVQKGLSESPKAKLLDIPDITGEMYDWWFGWHLVDSARYKLWNPVAHQYAWRFPETLDWANKTLPQRYIGTFSQIDEYIGNDAQKITIAFVDPAVLGFEKEKWAEQGIETIVTARILIGE